MLRKNSEFPPGFSIINRRSAPTQVDKCPQKHEEEENERRDAEGQESRKSGKRKRDAQGGVRHPEGEEDKGRCCEKSRYAESPSEGRRLGPRKREPASRGGQQKEIPGQGRKEQGGEEGKGKQGERPASALGKAEGKEREETGHEDDGRESCLQLPGKGASPRGQPPRGDSQGVDGKGERPGKREGWEKTAHGEGGEEREGEKERQEAAVQGHGVARREDDGGENRDPDGLFRGEITKGDGGRRQGKKGEKPRIPALRKGSEEAEGKEDQADGIDRGHGQSVPSPRLLFHSGRSRVRGMKITYIDRAGWLVEAINCTILLDYTKGKIPPLREEKPVYVLATHRHSGHFSPRIFRLADRYKDVYFYLSQDIQGGDRVSEEHADKVVWVSPGQKFSLARFWMQACPSTDMGVAFSIQVSTYDIFFAGDLNDWQWKAGDKDMRKRYAEIVAGLDPHYDAAILPLDPRLGSRMCDGAKVFLGGRAVDHVLPSHFQDDWSVPSRASALLGRDVEGVSRKGWSCEI